MPTFDTPEPTHLRVRNPAGDIAVNASQRDTTEVSVEPADPGRQVDVQAAQETRVEHRDGTIIVEAPQDHRSGGRTPQVNVRVALPEGSSIAAEMASADLRTTGRLGETEARSASGDVHIEYATSLAAETASGDLTVELVDGKAVAKTASGDLALGTVNGDCVASTASGDAAVRAVQGDLTITSASGDITVKSVGGSLNAKAASGDVRIGSVRTGRALLNTASGDVTIGIAEGTTAWLQLNSMSGDIRSELESTEAPAATTSETVEVDVQTMSGDITVKRA